MTLGNYYLDPKTCFGRRPDGRTEYVAPLYNPGNVVPPRCNGRDADEVARGQLRLAITGLLCISFDLYFEEGR